MSNWTYDSGGHKKNQKAYRENWERIFGKKEKSDESQQSSGETRENIQQGSDPQGSQESL